jgi:hypothetical protein
MWMCYFLQTAFLHIAQNWFCKIFKIKNLVPLLRIVGFVIFILPIHQLPVIANTTPFVRRGLAWVAAAAGFGVGGSGGKAENVMLSCYTMISRYLNE